MSSTPFDLVNNHADQVKFFVSSFLIWGGIFLIVEKVIQIKQLPKKLADDTKNRLVSIIHGQFTFWGAAYIIISINITYNLDYPSTFGEINQQEQHVLIIVSMSYFLYDLLACIYYDLADTALGVHHALALSGYLAAVLKAYGGFATVTAIFSAEVSNLPMHLRMILRNLGLRYTKLYEFCELSYFILYASFRGGLVPWLVYQTWVSPQCPTFVKLSSAGLFGQSIYYILEMRKIYGNIRQQQADRKRLGITYRWISVPENVWTLPYIKKGVKKEVIF